MLQLTDDTFDQEVLNFDKPVLVDFWAPWCGPCRMLAPILDELSKEYEGKAKICKINVDENPAMTSYYRVSGIPCLKFFKQGVIVDEMVGMSPKGNIAKKLETILAD
ncbi:thioredoxin [bacterium]|nr:thioredoxin [bacterium]MBU1753610.1 thioredoxin [bacterium]